MQYDIPCSADIEGVKSTDTYTAAACEKAVNDAVFFKQRACVVAIAAFFIFHEHANSPKNKSIKHITLLL